MKDKIGSYTIINRQRIEFRTFVLAEDLSKDADNRYFAGKLDALEVVSDCVTGSYAEAVVHYGKLIVSAVQCWQRGFEKIKECGADKELTGRDCTPITDTDTVEGKVVVIDSSSLDPEFRCAAYQLKYCTGGFGAQANHRGRVCHLVSLYNRDESSCTRNEILGIVEESKLPAWAKEVYNTLTARNPAEEAHNKYTVCVAAQEEIKYAARQSHQIAGQTGLIGYFDIGIDSYGDIWKDWTDIRENLKIAEFRKELEDIIAELREEGNILYDRKSLAEYCISHPMCKIDNGREVYYFRISTDNYAYLISADLDSSPCVRTNWCLFCYKKGWLDDHIAQARKGIRFIDSNYNELFRLVDGGKIEITYPNGAKSTFVCRYVDDYHVELCGGYIYHICEFAEKMESAGNTVRPVEEEE